MSLIALKNIEKTFENSELKTTVLRNLDLTVERGEFAAIMGASGSGKSTLMYIIGCLDRASDGGYFFDAQNVSGLDDDALSALRAQHFGFVFQAFYLVPYLNVLDNVLLPTLYDKRDKKIDDTQRAKTLLEKLGLSDRIYFAADQLSGGQKQRVAIARALMNDPDVILADEPTGQLDSESGKTVMQILSDLNKEGKTVLVVTHDPAIAAFAKRIIRISDGRIEDR